MPRRLVRAVRLDRVDRVEFDRRARRLAEDTAPHSEGQGTPAALKIYENDIAAKLETLIE